jgi:hypothetical protein
MTCKHFLDGNASASTETRLPLQERRNRTKCAREGWPFAPFRGARELARRAVTRWM